NDGKGAKIEDSFVIDGIINPILQSRYDYICQIEDEYLKGFKSYFARFAESSGHSVADFVEDEAREFGRLFLPGGNAGGWKYLSARLNSEEDYVEELYSMRAAATSLISNKIIAGKDDTFLGHVGILRAIRGYLNYLKTYSSDKI